MFGKRITLEWTLGCIFPLFSTRQEKYVLSLPVVRTEEPDKVWMSLEVLGMYGGFTCSDHTTRVSRPRYLNTDGGQSGVNK